MKTIELPNGQQTLVDDEDFDSLSAKKWFVSANGYASRTLRDAKGRRSSRMHREVIGAIPGQLVDHVNGNKLDNRKCNLRLCTSSQNMGNAKKYRCNKSGYKGVYREKKRWVAQIKFHGKGMRLGVFDDPKEAHKAYCAKAKELFGEFFNDGKAVPHE